MYVSNRLTSLFVKRGFYRFKFSIIKHLIGCSNHVTIICNQGLSWRSCITVVLFALFPFVFSCFSSFFLSQLICFSHLLLLFFSFLSLLPTVSTQKTKHRQDGQ